MDDTVIVLSSDDEPTPKVSRNKTVEEDENEGEICVVYKNLNPACKRKKTTHSQSGSSKSSVFTDFVATCYRLNNSQTMRRIVKHKLGKYYSHLIPEYRRSDEFHALIARKEAEIIRFPSHLFQNLKELADELRSHRCEERGKRISKTSDDHVRRLCIALESLQREIKDLEETEVCWEDEENSSYLKLQRYRRRIVKVFSKLNEIEGHSSSLLKRKVSFSGTQFPSVNKTVEKFVNAREEFPNYQDIFEFLKTAYASNGIKIPTDKLKSEAKSAFLHVGEQLQKCRQYECWEAHSAFLHQEADPADASLELRCALDENQMKFGCRVDEIINSYAATPIKLKGETQDRHSVETKRMKENFEQGVRSQEVQGHSENEIHEAIEQEVSEPNEKGKEYSDEFRQKSGMGEVILSDFGEDYAGNIVKYRKVDDCENGLRSVDCGVDIDTSPLQITGVPFQSSTTSKIGCPGSNNGCFLASKRKHDTIPCSSGFDDRESVETRIMRELHVFRDSPPRVKSKFLRKSLQKSCVTEIPEVIVVD